MPTTVFQIPLWAELAAAALGGLQGALFAATRADRRIDLLGVIVVGLAVALGGSLLRDIVLNQPPVVVWMNAYLIAAGAAAMAGMLLHPLVARVDPLITVLDAVVMGLFGAIATTKALSLGVGEVGALAVGVIGAIGGGLLRDLLLALPVSFLQVGTLYAVAAAAGSSILVLTVRLGTPVVVAALIGAGVTVVVRLAAVVFGWRFPEAGRLRLRSRPRPTDGTD